MKSAKAAQPGQRLQGMQLAIAIGLAVLLLLAILSELQAAPELRAQNINTYPVTYGSPGLAAMNTWDSVKVIDPVVIKDSGLYKMWYTGWGLDGKLRVGYATSIDGAQWTKYLENPVLDVGTSGAWDSDIMRVTSVIKDGNTYRMWYLGNGHQRIGYATSTDGIDWTKYVGNPVFDVGPSSSWDEGAVSFAGIISDTGFFKMWYAGGGASGFGGTVQTGYATSTNGIDWTRFISNPVLGVGPLAWDAVWVFDPHVISDGVAYKMWYSGLDVLPIENGIMRIGLATSTDAISWTKSISNPVLDVDPASWDRSTATAPWVLFDGSTYHMWYHGGQVGRPEMIGYATSIDGITWTKYAGNPVLGPTRKLYLPVIVKNYG